MLTKIQFWSVIVVDSAFLVHWLGETKGKNFQTYSCRSVENSR